MEIKMNTTENGTTLPTYDKKQIEMLNNSNDIIEIKKSSKSKLLCLKWFIKYFVSTIIGFIFGYSMEKAHVYEPYFIRQQMILKRFIMLKMFLAALATSLVVILFVALIFKNKYTKVFQSAKDALKSKSIAILITGGLLIGFGMQISGACPGMVLVQLGAGVPWSYITLCGSFCGAFVHGLLGTKLFEASSNSGNIFVSKALFELVPINPIVTRVLLIIILTSIVFLFEFFFPWMNDVNDAIVANSANIFIYKAWPPYACGILLGSLQLVNLLALEKSLGASSFYSTFVGAPICTKYLKEKFPYLAKFRSGLQNWLSLAFTIGSVLGAFASSYPSGSFGQSVGVHPYNAFLGGFVMVFGARIAGGCTSGHGISGCSHQLIGSFITTASMFAGAFMLAFYAYTNTFF